MPCWDGSHRSRGVSGPFLALLKTQERLSEFPPLPPCRLNLLFSTGEAWRLLILPPTSRICAVPDARRRRSAISSNLSYMLCLRRDAKTPQPMPQNRLPLLMRPPRSPLCSPRTRPASPLQLMPPPAAPPLFLPFRLPFLSAMPLVIPSHRMAASRSPPRMPRFLPRRCKRSLTCASSLATRSPPAAVIPPAASFTCNGSKRSDRAMTTLPRCMAVITSSACSSRRTCNGRKTAQAILLK